MKSVLLAGAIICGFIGVGLAQSRPTYPYKTVAYIAADNHVLPSPEGAHHRVERTFRDSLTGTVRVYDAAGKIKEVTPYADMARLTTYGVHTTYYESGQMHTKEDLVANKRNGEFVVYFPDGKLKRRETYKANERKTADCFGADGNPVAYFPYEVMPTYRGGGTEKIVQSIQNNTRYPAEALRNHTEGRVFVSFRVAPTGEVADVKIVKGISEELDLATIAAVKRLGKFSPGLQDGEAVSVSFTMPITFKITQAPFPSPNKTSDFGTPSPGFPR